MSSELKLKFYNPMHVKAIEYISLDLVEAKQFVSQNKYLLVAVDD